MDTNIVSAVTTDDQEAVADDFRRYDLTSVAVCDKENRLVGIITIDDIVDVIQDENTEDIKKMAAIIPSDEDYMKTSVWSLVAHRLPWLMLLMISATFTSTIITHFETLLSGRGAAHRVHPDADGQRRQLRQPDFCHRHSQPRAG